MKNNKLRKGTLSLVILLGTATLMVGCGDLKDRVSDQVKEGIRDAVIDTIGEKGSEIYKDAYNEKGEGIGTELDSFVDMKIDELINSEEYISASVDDRKTMAEEVITSLRLMGAIKNVEYIAEDKMYTFEYFSGALGGLKLEDWDPVMN